MSFVKNKKRNTMAGGPIPALTPDQMKDLLVSLSNQNCSPDKNPQIDNEQFRKVSREIHDVVTRFRPSGYNQMLIPMLTAMMPIFDTYGITPKQYWHDVWIRAGRKDCLDYNKYTRE